MADHERTELVFEALDIALWTRQPEQGSCITPTGVVNIRLLRSGAAAKEAASFPRWNQGATPMTNSLFSTLEKQLLAENRFESRGGASVAIVDIEWFYKRFRMHFVDRQHITVGIREGVLR